MAEILLYNKEDLLNISYIPEETIDTMNLSINEIEALPENIKEVYIERIQILKDIELAEKV
jgi:hypothetical protein